MEIRLPRVNENQDFGIGSFCNGMFPQMSRVIF